MGPRLLAAWVANNERCRPLAHNFLDVLDLDDDEGKIKDCPEDWLKPRLRHPSADLEKVCKRVWEGWSVIESSVTVRFLSNTSAKTKFTAAFDAAKLFQYPPSERMTGAQKMIASSKFPPIRHDTVVVFGARATIARSTNGVTEFAEATARGNVLTNVRFHALCQGKEHKVIVWDIYGKGPAWWKKTRVSSSLVKKFCILAPPTQQVMKCVTNSNGTPVLTARADELSRLSIESVAPVFQMI